MLPFSTKEGVTLNYIDSLFLSTSAICVTGLISAPYSLCDLLTPIGQLFLLLLVEIGGLGFITLVTFAFSFKRRKVDVATNLLLKEAMNQDSYSELIPLAKRIVITSFSIQGVGFLLNVIAFLIEGENILDALWYGLFHAGSSFNNAGFDILGVNSLNNYRNNILLMATTAALIILGGLGFVVMFDILEKKKYKRLNTHSKIVIKSTILILIIGTVILKLTSSLDDFTWGDAFMQVVFARTAGFYSYDLFKFIGTSETSIVIICIIMFIGGSPGSIAGGVKTTTFYTISKYLSAFIRGKKHVISNNREIREDSILKSFILVTISFIFIVLMSFLVLCFDPKLTITQVLFEVVSGFATCGTTLGITPNLSEISKILVIITMYVGRLGPFTFISLLNSSSSNDGNKIGYIEEKIIIG